MDKFFIILIKGVTGLIWMLATIITSVLLSPFILIAWISKILGKKKKNVAKEEITEIKQREVSHHDY